MVQPECKTCWAYPYEHKDLNPIIRRCSLWNPKWDVNSEKIKECPCFECITKMVCKRQCQARKNFWNSFNFKVVCPR